MTPASLRRAVDLLPRFDQILPNGKRYTTWHAKGGSVMTSHRRAPKKTTDVFDKIVQQADSWGYHWPVRMVDLSDYDVLVFHASLTLKTLRYLCGQNWKWNQWPRKRLPIYISYGGKLLIWNGTHRMTLGMLANRKVRCRLLVVEDYVKWKKQHPERKPAPKVIKVVAKKGKRK